MKRTRGVLLAVGCLIGVAGVGAIGAVGATDALPHAAKGVADTTTEQAAIRSVLDMQVAAWNRGDIDAFMSGYWKSEELEFVSGSGVTRGWQGVLDRYKRNYGNRAAMGTLSFSDLEIHVECADRAYAVGKFQLVREKDSPYGYFTLNFRKFEDGWKIIIDHTTAAEVKKAQ